MKLIWMNTFKSSIFILFIFQFSNCLLFNSKKTKINNNLISIPLVDDFVTICFKNKYDDQLLFNFEFGTYAAYEEIPIDMVLDRDTFEFVVRDYVRVNKSSLLSLDSVYGYFEKQGFISKNFIINPNLNPNIVEIEPIPSRIVIKALYPEFKNQFDSLNILVTKKNEFHKTPDNHVVQKFIIEPRHLSDDLSIITFSLNPNDEFEFIVTSYFGTYVRNIIYNFEYQPSTEIIISVN